MGPYPFDFLIFKNAFGYKGLFRLSCLEEVLPSCPPWPLFLYLHGPLIFFFFQLHLFEFLVCPPCGAVKLHTSRDHVRSAQHCSTST